jgi:hypothetical protein
LQNPGPVGNLLCSNWSTSEKEEGKGRVTPGAASEGIKNATHNTFAKFFGTR